ncbi:MAG TPA: hypothetical protein VHG90_15115 [Acidimicrobiales bacterium]|nr:hypothetical protein [Acidimicrobiales bacterium]
MAHVRKSIAVERPVTTVYNQWTHGIVERRAEGDLERFKNFIEQREVETGAWRGRVE